MNELRLDGRPFVRVICPRMRQVYGEVLPLDRLPVVTRRTAEVVTEEGLYQGRVVLVDFWRLPAGSLLSAAAALSESFQVPAERCVRELFKHGLRISVNVIDRKQPACLQGPAELLRGLMYEIN